MKTKLISAIALLLTAATAWAEPVVVIWIPQAEFDRAASARQGALTELWGKSQSSADKAWADSGWLMGVDTNGVTGMVYVVTEKQVQGRATPARVAKWQTALANRGVRIWTGLATYLDAGIELVKPDEPR